MVPMTLLCSQINKQHSTSFLHLWVHKERNKSQLLEKSVSNIDDHEFCLLRNISWADAFEAQIKRKVSQCQRKRLRCWGVIHWPDGPTFLCVRDLREGHVTFLRRTKCHYTLSSKKYFFEDFFVIFCMRYNWLLIRTVDPCKKKTHFKGTAEWKAFDSSIGWMEL